MKALRTVKLLALAAIVLLIAESGPSAWAQTQSGQPTANNAPATAFNPATDKLDRAKAGPITRPMIVEIADGTYFLNEFGMDAQYLLLGTECALLIDTGSGFYDMKGTIAKLTKLPYDVVITHGHPDHAGGHRQVYLCASFAEEGVHRRA